MSLIYKTKQNQTLINVVMKRQVFSLTTNHYTQQNDHSQPTFIKTHPLACTLFTQKELIKSLVLEITSCKTDKRQDGAGLVDRQCRKSGTSTRMTR